jgi:TPR repeat protein
MFCWIIRMRVTRFLIPILPTLLLLIVLIPAHADFQAGLAAYDQGDYATALKGFLPLSQQGDVKAQFNMGILYEKGQGVPQDFQEAFRWYYLAAAQFNLGFLYATGVGVPQNYTEAGRWYWLAAQQGYAEAQHNLGYLYHVGQGGRPQDFVQAHMWYNLAAAQGVKNSRQLRDHLSSLMSPTQVDAAQQLAREWRPTPNP